MVVLFDLGKVILDFDHGLVTRRLARKSRVPEKRIHEVIFGGNLESLYDRGVVSSQDFYHEVVDSLYIKMPFEEFRDIWTRIFTANEDVCNVIRALKDPCKLILLSNTNEMHFEYALAEFEILHAFDDYILSYQVGERKPHPKIYIAALDRAGCPARECVYIDDMEEYVSAASQLGLRGLVFRDAQHLRGDLRALNVCE